MVLDVLDWLAIIVVCFVLLLLIILVVRSFKRRKDAEVIRTEYGFRNKGIK